MCEITTWICSRELEGSTTAFSRVQDIGLHILKRIRELGQPTLDETFVMVYDFRGTHSEFVSDTSGCWSMWYGEFRENNEVLEVG